MINDYGSLRIHSFRYTSSLLQNISSTFSNSQSYCTCILVGSSVSGINYIFAQRFDDNLPDQMKILSRSIAQINLCGIAIYGACPIPNDQG